MPTAEKWIIVVSKYPPRHLSRVKFQVVNILEQLYLSHDIA